MSDFGDLEPADVVDTDPPDPGVSARFVYAKLRELTGDTERKLYDELDPVEQWVVAVAFRLWIDKLIREWQKPPL